MRLPSLVLAVAGILLCGFATAQPDTGYDVPRTAFGHPDLQGVWNFSSDIPLERPKEFADKEFLTRDEVAKLVADREKMFEVALTTGVGVHDKFWLDYKG